MLGYYEYFPQKRMNVSVKETGESKYKILVAEKDFEAGDVIYKVRVFQPDCLHVITV